MACREGCVTKDHESWAACARAANVTVNAMVTSQFQRMYGQTKRDLSAYRQARADGIQPAGTTERKVNAAVEATRLLGRPYDAAHDPQPGLLRSANVRSYVKESE